MSASPRSLASRLTARLFAIAGAALVVNMLAVGLYYGFDRRAMEGEVVEHRLGLVSEAFDPVSSRVDASARALYEAHPEAYAFVVADAEGRVLDAANPGLVPRRAFKEAAFADDWLAHRKSGSRSLLIASKKATLGGRELRLVFVMHEDPAHLLPRALLAEFVGHIWLPIVPVVVLLIAANAVLIRRGLAPVATAARWARSIQPGHPPAPLPAGDLPSEIVDLVDATRRSLDRLNDALSAEKRRAAEAAHALRTPVAVLAARLDALPPGPAADQLRADVVALARTVRQVLASANADALQVDESLRADLGAVASRVASALAAFAASRDVELDLELPPEPIVVAADPDALELALSNLVENAIVHGGAGVVDLTVGPGPEVRVRDRGPGIPPGAGRSLFQPFWRGADAAPGGAGLGLAIVERVQRAQGGDVQVEAPADGGAAFRLRFRSG
ncbi:sensor histidine kinase [Silanimonas sp.]|jgi:two-component system OmpR family sensor kinase|uniref:sensor histidine kinase n=1 Tax=Silanimonas sp. TaxID=1929290 RepID=UPI0037CC5DD9